MIVKAKIDLGIEDASKNNKIYDEQLKIIESELVDLKNVWNEMKVLNEKLDELKETKWLLIKPKQIRNNLDELLEKLKKLPLRMKRFEIVTFNVAFLNECLKNNHLLNDLKSEALKDRHWEQIMKHLNVSWNLNELNLGEIWQTDLTKREPILKDILIVAQGEKALEEYLKQVMIKK